MTETVPAMRCPYCNKVWVPRTPKPKYCPHCHRSLELAPDIMKRREERRLVNIETSNLVTATTYTLCGVCGKPAIVRVIDQNDKYVFCKEHLLQYAMSLKQPTVDEVTEETNRLRKAQELQG